jgi:HEPN domain-containing protein
MTRQRFSGYSEQWKASIHRHVDAQRLFDAQRWRGAMYLAGYAVECRLKAQLMRRWDCWNLPELEGELQQRNLQTSAYTHNLEALLALSGGQDRMRQNRSTWRAFNEVNRWLPAWRYSPDGASREQCEDFLEAVQVILNWIDHNI